jgi:sister chromatid cohesion protein DCC1
VAVLCTDDKTYNIRQVNTSNSVYILQPSDTQTNGAGPSAPSLQAIAQSGFTLELSPVSPKEANAIPHIRTALPTYSSTGHYQSRQVATKEDLYANIPFSDQECEAAWRSLACFQLTDPPSCLIPSGEAKVRAWRSIVQQAQILGINLTAPLSPAQSAQIIDVSEEWPLELTVAVRDSMSTTDKDERRFVEDQCVATVGLNQLDASTQGRSPVSVEDFLAAWRDQLPEKWREKAILESIKSSYVLENDEKSIKLANVGGDAAAGEGKAAAAATKSLGAKRKWHEKFRSSKKAA